MTMIPILIWRRDMGRLLLTGPWSLANSRPWLRGEFLHITIAMNLHLHASEHAVFAMLMITITISGHKTSRRKKLFMNWDITDVDQIDGWLLRLVSNKCIYTKKDKFFNREKVIKVSKWRIIKLYSFMVAMCWRQFGSFQNQDGQETYLHNVSQVIF